MVLTLNSLKAEQETTMQMTKVIRNDWGSPSGERLVRLGVSEWTLLVHPM